MQCFQLAWADRPIRECGSFEPPADEKVFPRPRTPRLSHRSYPPAHILEPTTCTCVWRERAAADQAQLGHSIPPSPWAVWESGSLIRGWVAFVWRRGQQDQPQTVGITTHNGCGFWI